MGFHTFDPSRADKLEDESRYRYLSREELVAGLDPDPADSVADLGSGTGFFTDDVAPFAGDVRAVDLQAEMHELYREKGVPENVELVTADVADLPFADAELDGAFSTQTFHEFASPESVAEVARVLASGARFVVADWTANGRGESGPPLDERYDCEQAVELLEKAGFEIVRADERPETLFVVAQR
ncbi:class I SAM-dependent methyltransferase [Halorussus amylolyticus]|uniref:class I SAM-dependent methyltransferase n=1 Tax=Halorussus amylolyticus TaxID=1126242 RepID=UPI001052058A|nr:class I SAM-dependent methyltransferase [Halorussus amylolyticus]